MDRFELGAVRATAAVSHYFQNIVLLWKLRLLDEQFVRVLVDEKQAELFCLHVEPMEKQISANYEVSPFVRIANLYDSVTRAREVASAPHA